MNNKVALTSARVQALVCESGKHQTIHWDAKTPGFGLRVTAGGARAYVFESRLFGKSLRMTIGDARAWELGLARAEATRLKMLVNEGRDPREVKADLRQAHAARRQEAVGTETTFGEAWEAYLEARRPYWSERHYADHVKHAAPGGVIKKRGTGLTQSGPLSTLRPLRLRELTSAWIAEWLTVQSRTRPTMTALSFRLLRGFIRWASEIPSYSGLIPSQSYQTRSVKDAVPRVKAKDGDCLQREQLTVWFGAVRLIANPIISAYLQALLITGARREELAALKWVDVDFRWRSITLNDKVEGTGGRTIPMTPYVSQLLTNLKQINGKQPSDRRLNRLEAAGRSWTPSQWVFASETSATGRLSEPRSAHAKALSRAGLPHITLHGLRRSFGTLAEWPETPAGVIAQIQGHKPSAIAEKHYRRRPIDLLRKWHERIEGWMLEQAGIELVEKENAAEEITK